MNNDIMNLEEATAFLKFKDTETIRKMCKRKQIPYMKVTNEYRFSKIALSMWVSGLDVTHVYEKMAEKMFNEVKEEVCI